MVGVGLDDVAQPRLLQELAFALGQVDGHVRALGFARRLLDGEFPLAVRGPQPRRVLAGPTGQDVDFLGDHERRIETDPELADQRQVVIGVTGKPIDERLGAGARDGAEVLGQVLAAHADAIVGEGQ